jgi:GNAT superfamily N-acetyltransferase
MRTAETFGFELGAHAAVARVTNDGGAVARSWEVRRLGIDDVGLIGRIDRSEHVEVEYIVVEGELSERAPSMTEIPPWNPIGMEPFSVLAQVAFCEPLVARGAVLLGAFEGDGVLGLAVVDGWFEPPLAWLPFLHVGRPHRRRGVASSLWDAAVELAAAAGADSMYVSAVRTGSAVGFYLSRGCVLADPVHPRLFAKEPDDIHLLFSLG